jgi:pyridoxine/pyridoxamine 5'-phosphate oxidase
VNVDHLELIAFVRRRGQAVLASSGLDGAPQQTHVPIAITDQAEIVFEMSVHSREYQNIATFALVAMMIGDGEEVTVECEGTVDLLTGDDRDRCLRTYFQQHPDARERALASYLVHARIIPRTLQLRDHRDGSYGVEQIVLDRGQQQ